MIDQDHLAWVGADRPNAARVHGYLLGGKDHFGVDRAVADRITGVFPGAGLLARANQRFLARAVRFCAEEGVDQFLHIGTGMPTTPAVQDVARAVRPWARIVGADLDPVALCYGRALVDDGAGTRIVEGGLRRPAEILANPVVEQLIDFGRPVAVLAVSSAEGVADDTAVAEAFALLRDRMAPGSALVYSHVTSTGSAPGVLERLAGVCRDSGCEVAFRNRERILALAGGFGLVEPGLVDVQCWRGEPGTSGRPMDVRILGGVAYKP